MIPTGWSNIVSSVPPGLDLFSCRYTHRSNGGLFSDVPLGQGQLQDNLRIKPNPLAFAFQTDFPTVTQNEILERGG